MKVSIITAALNRAETIEGCIRSVLEQTHPHIEHIIIDGGSTDGTVELVRNYEGRLAHWVSEPDSGIFDALNKGLRAASGDVIGTLGADDFYPDDRVIETVVETFSRSGCDCCFGDKLYVDHKDATRAVRYWVASGYAPGRFRLGWMPPHLAFYAKRELFERFGFYRTDLPISADYELMLRFMERHRVSARYIPRILAKMRTGGLSTQGLRSRIEQSFEDYRAWKVNGLRGGLFAVVMKKVRKLPQLVRRPSAP